MDSINVTLRTELLERRYQFAKKTNGTRPLSDIPAIKTFIYWRIVPNDFPYNVAFKTHDLLIPNREYAGWKDLPRLAQAEFRWILDNYCQNRYDMIVENTHHRRTVHNLYHVHLLTYYDDRKEMSL